MTILVECSFGWVGAFGICIIVTSCIRFSMAASLPLFLSRFTRLLSLSHENP